MCIECNRLQGLKIFVKCDSKEEILVLPCLDPFRPLHHALEHIKRDDER